MLWALAARLTGNQEDYDRAVESAADRGAEVASLDQVPQAGS